MKESREKPLLRKTFSYGWVLIGCLVLTFSSYHFYAQAQGSQYNTLDSTTKRSLDELSRLLATGDTEKVELQLQRVIQGSGFIEPLAEIYYKLAQNEQDLEKVVSYYSTMLEHWELSPWSAKALTEFIPLILMSGGASNQMVDEMIWMKMNRILEATSKAAAIGEDPKSLEKNVLLNLLQLAHLRGDMARLTEISGRIAAHAEELQDQAELAVAYANIRQQNYEIAAREVDQWLTKYANSNLRPFAILALFHAAQNRELQTKAIRMMDENFSDTLEAHMLGKYR